MDIKPPTLLPADAGQAGERAGRRVTSYDVAHLAGVSQSAVSRCFKPGASVSKATYARVMQAARALDYTPNAAARSLITRRSNLVALVASELAIAHAPELMTELARGFAARGMRLVLFSFANEADIGTTLAEVFRHQVDGAVVGAHLQTAQVAEFGRRRVPFVLFNRRPADHAVSMVACDQREAARALVTRLAAAGHKRFAFVDGPAASPVACERRLGVEARLAELGLCAPLVCRGNYDYASGARAMREIMARAATPPDVVICANDVMAIGAIDCARHEFKLAVPARLSVTGFDGIAASAWLSYNLTTARLPLRDMATATVDMLAGLLAHEAQPAQRLFGAQLIEGATARLGPAG